MGLRCIVFRMVMEWWFIPQTSLAIGGYLIADIIVIGKKDININIGIFSINNINSNINNMNLTHHRSFRTAHDRTFGRCVP